MKKALILTFGSIVSIIHCSESRRFKSHDLINQVIRKGMKSTFNDRYNGTQTFQPSDENCSALLTLIAASRGFLSNPMYGHQSSAEKRLMEEMEAILTTHCPQKFFRSPKDTTDSEKPVDAQAVIDQSIERAFERLNPGTFISQKSTCSDLFLAIA